jgi:hypothetical protein
MAPRRVVEKAIAYFGGMTQQRFIAEVGWLVGWARLTFIQFFTIVLMAFVLRRRMAIDMRKTMMSRSVLQRQIHSSRLRQSEHIFVVTPPFPQEPANTPLAPRHPRQQPLHPLQIYTRKPTKSLPNNQVPLHSRPIANPTANTPHNTKKQP